MFQFLLAIMCQKYGKVPKFQKPISVVGLYYSHGLVCASYPGTVLGFVSVVVILCSLPYFITTSGDLNSPKPWRSPWLNYRTADGGSETPQWIINNPAQFSGRTPSWFLGLPLSVIQQVYIQVQVNCSNAKDVCHKSHYSIIRMVAAHALAEMNEAITKCRYVVHPAVVNLTLSLDPSGSFPALYSRQVGANSPPHTKLPVHFIGILSPVLDSIRHNFNDSDNNAFDDHFIKELLYGGFWEYYHSHSAGVMNENYNGKNHRFALTFFFKATKEDFSELTECVKAIKGVWPEERKGLKFMKHFYYEPEWHVIDFAPLLGVYIIVFLYISFSVVKCLLDCQQVGEFIHNVERSYNGDGAEIFFDCFCKIDLVKSKIGLGITACMTVLASLTMSLGICTFFGLSISLSGSEIYPYVVITIGLENILIIVKAVISTPEELDVKYRIAVGLSKEGWAITRNLLTILAMNAMCILFFNYTFKEFSTIALVGLICDAFLQLVFFPTVLSIDLRRLELSDLNSTTIPVRENKSTNYERYCPKVFRLATPMRWKSRRVKFVYFIAQTRIVSKAIMFSVLMFLLAWFTKTETFHALMNSVIYNHKHPPVLATSNAQDYRPSLETFSDQRLNNMNVGENAQAKFGDANAATSNSPGDKFPSIATLDSSKVRISRINDDGFIVKCEAGEVCWRPMVTTHWPRLLEHYGYTLAGRFISLLPPVNLKFQLGYLNHPHPSPLPSLLTRLLSHPNAIRVSFLCFLAIVVFGYSALLVHLSKLRHMKYLQSERNWNYNNRKSCLKGHKLDVDCLCVTESGLIVTTGLDGEIRVWESHPMKRRCIQVIERSKCSTHFPASSSVDRPITNGWKEPERLNQSGELGYIIHQSFGTSGASVNSEVQQSSSASNESDIYVVKSGVRYHYSNQNSKSQHTRNYSSSSCNYPFSSQASHLTSIPLSPLATTIPVRRHSGSETPKNIPVYSVPFVQTGTNLSKAKVRSLPFEQTGFQHVYDSTPPQSQKYVTHRRARSGPVSYRFLTSIKQSPTNAANSILTRNSPLQSFETGPAHSDVHSLSRNPAHTNSLSNDIEPSTNRSEMFDSVERYGSISSADSYPMPVGKLLSSESSLFLKQHSDFKSTDRLCSVRHFDNGSSALHVHQPHVDVQLAPNSTTHGPNHPLNPVSLKHKESDTPVVQIHVDPISSPAISPPSGSSSPCQLHRTGHSRHHSLGHNTSKPKHSHSRNRSLGCINVLPSGKLNSRQSSISNLSMCSNLSSVSGNSAKSVNSTFVDESQLSKFPDPENGYDFAQHFNLFSQYTSNMALLYCSPKQRTGQLSPVPTVWCMDVWKSVIAVGCGNGQIEAWNSSNGSLIFTLSIGESGVTSIAVNSHGILSGHMDGSLILTGHDGIQRYCVPAHSKPVSILRVYGSNVVTGGYDGVVKVHRLVDFVCTNAIYIHPGSISALTWTATQLCVSGCSKGLIVCWDVISGQSVQEFEEPGVPVLMLESSVDYIICLLAEDSIKVWNCLMGDLLYSLKMDGICNGFAVLGSQNIAVCLEAVVAVYNVNTGKKQCEKQLDSERGVALVRQVFALDEATVICSIGKDVHIIPCDVKLKID